MNAQPKPKPSQGGYDEETTRVIMGVLEKLPIGEGIKFETLFSMPAIRLRITGQPHLIAVLKNMIRRALIYKHSCYGYAAVRGIDAVQPALVSSKDARAISKKKKPAPDRKAQGGFQKGDTFKVKPDAENKPAPKLAVAIGSLKVGDKIPAGTIIVQKAEQPPEEAVTMSDAAPEISRGSPMNADLMQAIEQMEAKIKAGERPCPRLSRIDEKIYAVEYVAKLADEPLRSLMIELSDDLQLLSKAS